MDRPVVAEFHDGPLDGTRRVQRELSPVHVEEVPGPAAPGWSMTKAESAGRSMVYVLRVDNTTGRPAPDGDGRYRYDFHGYQST
ncbi:hypothetical protein AB0873_12105 [Micromonospora sp. NPDC047707]|uniref:hypothetical protein n=1 Tax=Micromonospora sp. NPDC047707 TaxID=3154498 RepID=UPI003453F77F